MLNRFRLPIFSIRKYSSSSLKNAMVETSSDGGIHHIILNRDEGKNSLSTPMLAEFNEAVANVSSNKDARVVIISSSVPKVFCAGADLKERAKMSEDQIPEFVAKLRGSFQLVAEIPVPVIAAIDGAALGGGLELALACDLRIASKRSIIGLPETALAIIPGAGGTQRLPRTVGISKAKELIFLAKRLNGQEAFDIGLVTECVDTDTDTDGTANTVLEKAIELAKKITSHGPVGIRMAKKALDDGMSCSDMKSALNVEKTCYGQTVPTKDRVEGLLAFKEKRKPIYIGA
jgi:methylglutaconyl-CoA hydratase